MSSTPSIQKRRTPQSSPRCILFARTANIEQGKSSLDRQVRTLRQYADEHGFVVIEELRVIGSFTETKGEVEKLVLRKREQNDFDAVLVADFSKFSRHGLVGLHDLNRRLNEVGITLSSVTGAGDYSNLARILHHVAQDAYWAALSHRAKQAWAERKRKEGRSHE